PIASKRGVSDLRGRGVECGVDPRRHAAANVERKSETGRMSRGVPQRPSVRILECAAGSCDRRGAAMTPITRRVAPGPKGYMRIRSLIGLRGPRPIPWFLEWTRLYGDIVRFQIGPSVFHLVN